ncbi:MAG: hypothetical protein L3J08_07735 [Flavobacteriaceae bacterium]|nr:hypothetical protein [Flavobacteriaceae bacterium]
MSTKRIVINTSPLLALIAGLNSLDILHEMYDEVIVPNEVVNEITILNSSKFGADIFNNSIFLNKQFEDIEISPFLKNVLDIGEAAVIQSALNREITTVCIDESVARRVARLNGVKVTGSLGIIIKAIKKGKKLDFLDIVNNMRSKNIFLSDRLIKNASAILNSK